MEDDLDYAAKSADADATYMERPTKIKQSGALGINLLKRSKHDLLRLLSILEGELEARDIYISTLEARLNNQKNAKNHYFIHRLSDPLLALHRDDFMDAGGDCKSSSNELARIEPLPLLEKIIVRFKNQQQKMHHQMALSSKIHRKMAHELAEVKRKHSTNPDGVDELLEEWEKEKENLNATIMCERERTRRIENEYNKLLSLCRKEMNRHKIIVSSMLCEQANLWQQLNQSKEWHIDENSTETELASRLHKALQEKQDLAAALKEEGTKADALQSKVDRLQKKLRRTRQTAVHTRRLQLSRGMAPEHPGRALPEYDSAEISSDDDDEGSSVSDDAGLKRDGRYASDPETAEFMSKRHSMRVAQSTQDVTLVPTSSHPPSLLADGAGVTTSGYYRVKPGSSIPGLDAIRLAASNREMLLLDSANDDVFKNGAHSPNHTDRETTDSAKSPNIPAKAIPPKPFRYVQPPSPNSTPSLLPTSPAARSRIGISQSIAEKTFAYSQSQKVASRKAEQNRRHVPTLKAQSPISSGPRTLSEEFKATRLKFQNIPTVNGVSPAGLPKDGDKKGETKYRKEVSVQLRSGVPMVVDTTPTSLPTVVINTHSGSRNEYDRNKHPLPPKTKHSNVNSNNGNQARPPPLPPKKPSVSSDTPKRPSSTSHISKTPEPTFQRKSSSVIKRVSPAKSNEHSSNRIGKGPTPPALPAKMSSQPHQPTPPSGARQNHTSLTRSTSNEF